MCQVDCIQGSYWSVCSSGIFFTFSINKNYFHVKSGFQTHNEHSTDEGHSPKTCGRLLRFWHFHQHSSLKSFIVVTSALWPTKFFSFLHYLNSTVYWLILFQYCPTDTTREWLDTTHTTRTGRETLVYGSYRSWSNGDLHICNKTALQPRQYDSYDPYGSYGLWNNGTRVVQLVNWTA